MRCWATLPKRHHVSWNDSLRSEPRMTKDPLSPTNSGSGWAIGHQLALVWPQASKEPGNCHIKGSGYIKPSEGKGTWCYLQLGWNAQFTKWKHLVKFTFARFLPAFMPSACGDQKRARASDPLGLESQMVVRHHVRGWELNLHHPKNSKCS